MRVPLLACLVLLAGCEPPNRTDQTLRREIFMECMERAPAGPVTSHYNDWAEVVGECENAAYYQSQQTGPRPGKARAADTSSASLHE